MTKLKITYCHPDELSPWQENPRKNDVAVDTVVRSIKNFGFNVPILCDKKHRIIAGHTRWKAAKIIRCSKVPVIIINLTRNKRRAFSITDNKTSEIAEWNFPLLKEVLTDLEMKEINSKDLGFSECEIRKLFHEDTENQMPEAKSKRKVKPGELWELGKHRVLCGDSKDIKCQSKLTGRKEIDIIIGGPPYFNLRKYIKWSSFKKYEIDMLKIAENCSSRLKKGGIFVWCGSAIPSIDIDLLSHLSILLENVGLKHVDTIAWVKPGATFSLKRHCNIKSNNYYYPAFQWEALYVYQKAGKMPKMTKEGTKYMSEYSSNVWEIPPVLNKLNKLGHPDVWPVEIPYRLLQAYSGDNSCVLDPFGGSGTTLIAAEKAGRKAFIMESLPKYCDIILQRWENLSGKKAKKLE